MCTEHLAPQCTISLRGDSRGEDMEMLPEESGNLLKDVVSIRVSGTLRVLAAGFRCSPRPRAGFLVAVENGVKTDYPLHER